MFSSLHAERRIQKTPVCVDSPRESFALHDFPPPRLLDEHGYLQRNSCASPVVVFARQYEVSGGGKDGGNCEALFRTLLNQDSLCVERLLRKNRGDSLGGPTTCQTMTYAPASSRFIVLG